MAFQNLKDPLFKDQAVDQVDSNLNVAGAAKLSQRVCGAYKDTKIDHRNY